MLRMGLELEVAVNRGRAAAVLTRVTFSSSAGISNRQGRSEKLDLRFD